MPAIARSGAHALVRAVFALLRTPCVHTTVNAARISACATLLAFALLADTHADVVDLFASMAAALSDPNVPQFMKAVDKDIPGYEKLKADITALMTQTEVSSSVEPIKDDGDLTKRTVDLDWYLQIRSLVQDGPIVNRREVIHCELRKDGKHWKIVSLQPAEFFAPAKLDK
jgi:hypothetical protein